MFCLLFVFEEIMTALISKMSIFTSKMRARTSKVRPRTSKMSPWDSKKDLEVPFRVASMNIKRVCIVQVFTIKWL